MFALLFLEHLNNISIISYIILRFLIHDVKDTSEKAMEIFNYPGYLWEF